MSESVGNEESYVTKEDQVPVLDDNDNIEDGVDEATADTDAQLERDDNEAIDKSNIVKDRTRHAKPEGGSYKEPGDTEGIPIDE
ncbi:hypothetical protein N0V93_010015 [Gnomoniopsis smithogilvyi]|uniref:Histone chaperone domain-containing protein n=1 Tax=Gnomoniopsis smithogilvyi TaxID=1191159 RepID=A0A9W9CSV4_9PEZI|nr:hypothetical protein N0V93_010015 [Gnomoniopsis smithogilvyi]